MAEAPNQFGDGAAYERMMGRWSHLVGEKFLDWLDAPQGLRWIDVGCGMRNVATDVVRIQVAYDDFDDFLKSCNVPIGPAPSPI